MAKVKDESKSNCFHQTVELHLDYGSEVLRRVLKTKLQSKNISLMDHLSTPGVHSVVSQSYRKGHLHQNQWALLFPGKKQEPNLSELDITLLTYLLVHTKLSLTNNETKAIKDLRNKRNEISHVPKAELRDKTNFNTTRQLLLDVSKRILGQKAADEIMENIDSILTRKEFVSCRRNLELVKIRNEELMVKLVDRPINETGRIRFWFNILSFTLTITVSIIFFTTQTEEQNCVWCDPMFGGLPLGVIICK